MKKILIIDSNSLINRAFYAVRYLSSPDGKPTNAIFGFLTTLLKIFEEHSPDGVIAAFDLKAPTFRHKLYDAYKAQRKPMPDDLVVQMPLARELMRRMRIPVLELEGYEADDIIGTVSRLCEESGDRCLIATGDKDDLQLASEKTHILLTVTKAGRTDTDEYDAKAVFDRYGVTPEEFIDVKALMGDASDNIPGVSGIGEKTALSLISKFKSIENIYESFEENGFKGAQYNKLKDGKDSAFLSKTLATIDRNVPITMPEFSEGSYNASDDTDGSLYEFLKELGFDSIIKRLSLAPVDNLPATDILEGVEFISVTTTDELSGLVGELSKKQEFSYCFEIKNQLPTVLGIACDSKAYQIELAKIGEKAFELLKSVFTDSSIKKHTHSSKAAFVALNSYFRPCAIENDLEIAAYLINPTGSSYSIEDLCESLLKATISPGIANGPTQVSLFSDDDEDTAADELLTARKAAAIPMLCSEAARRLDEMGQTELYRTIELPLAEVLADMELAGFKVDTESLYEFSKALSIQINALTDTIYMLAGEEFNINSPRQLGVILFEKLGLKSGKKTKTGYSTGAEVLEKLSGSHEIIDCILEYRQLTKLKSTYCDAFLELINKDTGRIHSVFNQTVTATGRISSTEPNMQNIPTRTELGRELRKMFVVENDDYVLIDADYSQIELRVLAHIANDPVMIKAFESGEDIHTVTASQVFGVTPAEVTSLQRRRAKAINFGIVYGMGEFSLSQDLKISVAEAKSYINSYKEHYNGVASYMEEIKKTAAENGYVTTLLGRVRQIPELKSAKFNIRAFGERVALNTPIQGTAADIIKLAMIRVHKRLADYDARLILQVHDELIIEAHRSVADEVAKILKTEMEEAISLNVPLTVDLSTGRSWYDAK